MIDKKAFDSLHDIEQDASGNNLDEHRLEMDLARCVIFWLEIIFGPGILLNYYQGVSQPRFNEGNTEPQLLSSHIGQISDGRLTRGRCAARDTPGRHKN